MKFVFVGVSDDEKDGKLITFSRKRSRGKLAITMLKYAMTTMTYSTYFTITGSYKEPSKKQKGGSNKSDEELEPKPFLSECFELSCSHVLTAVSKIHSAHYLLFSELLSTTRRRKLAKSLRCES